MSNKRILMKWGSSILYLEGLWHLYVLTLQSIIALVTETPPTVESLAALTRDQREELRDWAGREHLSASDNLVRRRPRPAWLDGLPKEDSHVGDV
jgi:hypothetical protein